VTDNQCTCGQPANDAYICSSCCTAMEIALGNISAYWADLDTVKGRQTRYGGSGGGRGGEKPLPVDLRFLGVWEDGSMLQEATKNTIGTWARVVLEERSVLAGPAHVACLHVSCSIARRSRPPRDDVASCCRYLLGHADWIRTKDWAPEILDELDALEAQLRRIVDRPADKWFAGPCDGCDRDLYAKVGAKSVDCKECDRVYDIAIRRAALLAEAEDYLANATELARAVSWLGSEPLTAARVWKWAERGRITVKGHQEIRGKQIPQYRIGDALDLLAIDTTKKAG